MISSHILRVVVLVVMYFRLSVFAVGTCGPSRAIIK